MQLLLTVPIIRREGMSRSLLKEAKFVRLLIRSNRFLRESERLMPQVNFLFQDCGITTCMVLTRMEKRTFRISCLLGLPRFAIWVHRWMTLCGCEVRPHQGRSLGLASSLQGP